MDPDLLDDLHKSGTEFFEKLSAAVAALSEGPVVTVAIKGGAAHLVSPAGAKVTILDYDVDGVDESRLEEDDEGDMFERIELWS